MAEVNTNYNLPVPPEKVYGQTIGGPSVEKPKDNEQQNSERVEKNHKSEQNKGKYIDRYV